MTWSASDLTAIETAIASGHRTVKFHDREITYHSLAELMRLRAEIQRELGVQAGSTETYRSDRRYADFHNGMEPPS